MTNIQPSAGPLLQPLAERGSESFPVAGETGGVDFASLLASEAGHTPPDPLIAEKSISSKELCSELAEVFNAFGFFQPGNNPAEFPATDLALNPPPLATGLSGAFESAKKGLDPSMSAVGRGVILPFEAQQGFSSSIPASVQQPPAPQPTGRLAQPGTRHGSTVQPLSPQSRSQVSRQPLEKETLPKDSKIASRLPDAAAEQRDRLIFKIGTHLVELIGRLEGLSKEEEDRLVAQLTAILESHGLSLGSATLNGFPFVKNMFGRMHQWR